MAGSVASSAGLERAVAVEINIASTAICQMSPIKGMSAARIARMIADQTRIWRRSIRSATTPAAGESSTLGIC